MDHPVLCVISTYSCRVFQDAPIELRSHLCMLISLCELRTSHPSQVYVAVGETIQYTPSISDISKWPEHLQLCIDNDGGHFE